MYTSIAAVAVWPILIGNCKLDLEIVGVAPRGHREGLDEPRLGGQRMLEDEPDPQM